MTQRPESDAIEVLKNVVLTCEANGLRDLPFVLDAKRLIEQSAAAAVVTQASLKPCPHCKTKPFVSENNIPGDWYGYIECDNTSCEVRPSISFSGPFSEAVEEADQWNGLSSETPAEPQIVFDWQQVSNREWRADVAPGWWAEIRQSLSDDTWSFRVNNSGHCNLVSKEEAVTQAEEWMRSRVARAVSEARAVFAAFSLFPSPEAEGAAAPGIDAADIGRTLKTLAVAEPERYRAAVGKPELQDWFVKRIVENFDGKVTDSYVSDLVLTVFDFVGDRPVD